MGPQLVTLGFTHAPRPLPVQGRVLDVAGDGKRLWLLRLGDRWPEIDELDAAEQPHRRAVCRFAAAHLAWASGRLWAGGFSKNAQVVVRTFSENGSSGPAWVLSLEGATPLDGVERAVSDAFSGGLDGVLSGYDLVPLGGGAAIVFRRRNVILLLPSSGDVPNMVRWPSVGRDLENLIQDNRSSKHRLPITALTMVSAAVGLGADGVLVVEPWVEADISSIREYLETGKRRFREGAVSTLTWLSCGGNILHRWGLAWRPSAVALVNGNLIGLDSDGRARTIEVPGHPLWSQHVR